MKKVNDINQLSGLISPYLRKGILTNNYMMLGNYKNHIEKGELFFEKTEGGIIIFKNYDNHWRVFYYLKDLSTDLPLPMDKPLAMEIVFKTIDEKYQLALSYWENRGFKPYIFRKRMSTTFAEFNIKNSEKKHVSFAQNHHAVLVHQLICNTFDSYLGCVPSLSEVAEIIDKKEILLIQDPNGQLNGLLHIGQKHDTYFIWHLVVSPEVRQGGNAKKMLAYFKTMILKDEKTKIQLWVKNDNLPARHLYKSVGFKYDGWESIGLLYKPQKN